MTIIVSKELDAALSPILRHLGGAYKRMLVAERERTLNIMADSLDETVMRQYQGRARLLKELLDQIDVAQQ